MTVFCSHSTLRTENEVAKETEPVEETGDAPKELEPEDKEEKPQTEAVRFLLLYKICK